MKYILNTFLLLAYALTYGQTALDNLKQFEGIWIADDYYNSFEKTNSAIKSKEAFDHNYPVALRINTNEVNNGIMNIGYSVLHDHLLHPEVSKYVVKNADTIREQGNFEINLNKKDSLGYYKTIDIYYFNYDWISYFSCNTKNKTLTLYRPEGNNHKELFINFTQYSSGFKSDYPFPNPLYSYTRNKILKGDYTLKDHKGNVLSKKFRIKENGLVNGQKELDNFIVYYSTDIYCGLPLKNDLIIFCEDILDDDSKSFVFLIDTKKNGSIFLHKRKMSDIDESYTLGEKVYELIKNQ